MTCKETKGFGLALLLLLSLASAAVAEQQPAQTEVVVVPTLHGLHMRTPNYSYGSLMDVYKAVSPDAVAVEIRPEELAKGNVLDGPGEMAIFVDLAKQEHRPVYGIDWWLESTAKARSKNFQSADPVAEAHEMAELRSAFGNASFEEGLWGYADPRFQDMLRQDHNMRVRFYGDQSTVNSYQRNLWMTNRILRAAAKHPKQRLLVAVGYEHKFILENQLRLDPKIKVLDLRDFRSKIPDTPNMNPVSDGVLAMWREGVSRMKAKAAKLQPGSPKRKREEENIGAMETKIDRKGVCFSPEVEK